MSTNFILARDINGFNGFGLPPCYDSYTMTLVANTAQTVNIPLNFDNWVAVFMIEPGDSIWVAYNKTAVIPNGSAALNSYTELNPTAWYVQSRHVSGKNNGALVYTQNYISLVTADTSDNIGIKFYAYPTG